MSIDWFRSWHGAPTDPKWLLIAKRSETQAGIVSAIVWALFDYASQNTADRGSVESFDTETYAAFSGFDESTIVKVISCLKDKNMIVNGHLSAWEKRQPKREDNSTERVREHRNAMKRNETPGNDREEKRREDKEEKESKDAVASRPALEIVPSSEEADYFRRIKQICGSGAGGLGKKLLLAKDGSIPLARAAAEQASTKQDPREYLGAIIRTREEPECRPDRSF